MLKPHFYDELINGAIQIAREFNHLKKVSFDQTCSDSSAIQVELFAKVHLTASYPYGIFLYIFTS